MSNWSNNFGGVIFMGTGSVTQSSDGQAMIFPKTDGNIYKKNTSNIEYRILSGSSGTNPIVREYTANDTWTKPTASNFWGVMVYCFGPGGGGAGGRRGAANSIRGGGGGGASGALAIQIIPKSNLPSASYSIVVGAGGNGGAARTTDSTNGTFAGAVGFTAFANITASGGNTSAVPSSGQAGTATGGANTIYLSRGLVYYIGVSGGAGATVGTAASNGHTGFGTSIGSGGGGGGGISTANAVGNGGSGSTINYWNGSAFTTVNGGTGGDAATNKNGGTGSNFMFYLFDLSTTITNGIGTGGGGGAGGDLAGTIPGGNGGDGGRTAGGGGGGASTNGANSGAGGRGGDGLCIIVEYYGA